MHGWKKPEWVKALWIDAALANRHAKISKSRINVDKKRTLKKSADGSPAEGTAMTIRTGYCITKPPITLRKKTPKTDQRAFLTRQSRLS